MSRVGKQPIILPAGVNAVVQDGVLTVSGPKGELKQPILDGIKLELADGELLLIRRSDEPAVRARHGLMRTLIQNMVSGVSNGFEKKLELSGVGYRVAQAGENLELSLGFSHSVRYQIPQGVKASVEQNTITVSGIDKQRVNQVAAEIRALKKPEPYKGKGIKYVDEQIIRKSGKSGKEASA